MAQTSSGMNGHLNGPCETCDDANVLIVVPCHDEVVTIGDVVTSFRKHLPAADVLVADNASTDGTASAAREAGAVVVTVPVKGKGRAVRALLERSDHDVTILVDGDSTYDASVAATLVHRVWCEGYDLVNVARVSAEAGDEFRPGHQLGNAGLTSLQRVLTRIQLQDILTGYKAMSRRFVASLPLRSRGFQVEVEIAAHAVALDFAYCEVSGPYAARPAGSESKLSTYRDGWAILRSILRLYRDNHPLPAFSLMGAPWLLIAAISVGVAVIEYATTGMVTRFPTLIAGVAAFTVGMLLTSTGWILSRTQQNRRDTLAQIGAEAAREAARRQRAAPHLPVD